MTLKRGERRRRRERAAVDFTTRALRFITGWEGIIALAVVVVILVLGQGIMKLPLPFGIGQTPETPDPWGHVAVPRGTAPKILLVLNGAGGAQSGARQGVEFALREFGRIQNITAELEVVEDGCNADEATARAREAVADARLIGVISQACAASVVAQRAVLEEAKLPFLVVDNVEPALTASGTLASFRMRPAEKTQGRTAALFLRQDVTTRRAFVLHQGAPGAIEIAESFRTQYRGQGGQVADMRQVNASDDLAALVADIQALDVDLVYYLGAGAQGTAILAALKQQGYTGKVMVSEASYGDPAFTGDDREGTFATALQTPRADRFASWKEAFEKDMGAPGPLAPEAYDAAAALGQAASRLAKSESDGSLKIGRQALIGGIRSLPYQGVTGQLSFDANGDRAALLPAVMKFEGGQYVQVK